MFSYTPKHKTTLKLLLKALSEHVPSPEALQGVPAHYDGCTLSIINEREKQRTHNINYSPCVALKHLQSP